MKRPRCVAVIAVTLALAGCAAPPGSPSTGVAPQWATPCTEPAAWAPWTGGITASGTRQFCADRPRR